MTNSEPAASGGDAAGLRVGDAERNAAVAALGEHLTSGRLDLDEYGTRSAVAGTARTVGELQSLFLDLPTPHPPLPGIQALPLPPQRTPNTLAGNASRDRSPAVVDDRSKAQKLVAAASAGSAIIAVILFFATGQWWWFLLIPLISSVAGSVWGDSWKRPHPRR